MNIDRIFPIEELEDNVRKGFVSKRKHPGLPIYIYNYTPEATFANEWNEVTRTCRGLILDEFYNIIARPFRKFFNLNTGFEPSTQLENLPKTEPEIMDKMDGSLGIYWHYGNEEGIATRGSFDSEQARWATNYWKSLKFCRWYFDFGKDTTPLFEVIYPENRIVVNYYGDKKLVLLGVVRNKDGSEYSYNELKTTGYPDIVGVYSSGKSLEDCIAESKSEESVNAEGYVLKYPNGDGPYPLRIKIKLENYVRIHRLMFTVNDRVIWESVRDGKLIDVEIQKRLPEDVRQWILDQVKEFQLNYDLAAQTVEYLYNHKPEGDRKTIAQYFCQYPEHRSALFCMLDGKDYAPAIWKKLEPHRATSFRRVSNEEW